MSLVEDIESAIIDENSSLASILRRAIFLSDKLDNDELKDWIDKELDGYDNDSDDIPSYRKIEVSSLGNFLGPFHAQLKNQPIPTSSLPEPFQDFANNTNLTEGIGAYERLLDDKGPDKTFRIDWPADCLPFLHDTVIPKYSCMQAWKVLSAGQVEQVIDSVRTRLLRLVIELKRAYPNLAISDENATGIPDERIAAAVHTHIYGDHNVVAAGSHIKQHVDIEISKGDQGALAEHLGEIGVPADAINALLKAVASDGQLKEPTSLGQKVQAWIGHATVQIGSGTWKVSQATAPILIAKAISNYYGL